MFLLLPVSQSVCFCLLCGAHRHKPNTQYNTTHSSLTTDKPPPLKTTTPGEGEGSHQTDHKEFPPQAAGCLAGCSGRRGLRRLLFASRWMMFLHGEVTMGRREPHLHTQRGSLIPVPCIPPCPGLLKITTAPTALLTSSSPPPPCAQNRACLPRVR